MKFQNVDRDKKSNLDKSLTDLEFKKDSQKKNKSAHE